MPTWGRPRSTGTSPTKKSLALAPLAGPGVMADEVRRRPAGEPVEEVLGHAVLALLAGSDEKVSETMRQVLADNPRLNAGLLEWLTREYEHLVAALAERTGRPADDAALGASAWLAVFVLQQVEHARRSGRRRVSAEQAARRVMRDLAEIPLILPTAPRGAHPRA